MVNECLWWRTETATVFAIGIGRVWNVTKFISAFYMCFVLLIGCVESDLADPDSDFPNLPNLDDPIAREPILAKAVDDANVQIRQSPSGERLHYLPNQEVPYTGWVKDSMGLWQIKDGKRHGLYLTWYANQQNEEKGFYKNGFREGLWTRWYKNGQKSKEGAYKDGYRDGLWTFWKGNGQKSKEGVYKDGYGNSWWTFWDEDGQKYNGLIHPYVVSVAFSPDGRTLASGSWDRTVILWDVSIGQPTRTLKAHHGGVTSIAFSPDGRTLASGDENHLILLWPVVTDEPARILRGQHHTILSVAFSPDGRTLASGGNGRSIFLWDVETKRTRLLTADRGSVTSVAFSPDGRTLASVVIKSDDEIIRLWDIP